MNENDLYIEYLLEMGAMTPEQEKLARQQSYVDSLRQSAITAPQGRMVGNTYVAPSWAQYAAQLGNAYMARSGQKKLDDAYKEQSATDQDAVNRIRAEIARRRGKTLPSQAPVATGVVKRPFGIEDEQPY